MYQTLHTKIMSKFSSINKITFKSNIEYIRNIVDHRTCQIHRGKRCAYFVIHDRELLLLHFTWRLSYGAQKWNDLLSYTTTEIIVQIYNNSH